jgi:hypothetical protein
MAREIFEDQLQAARAAEVADTLVALMLFKGVITPAEAEVVRNGGNRNFADIAQPPAPPLSGLPTGGA